MCSIDVDDVVNEMVIGMEMSSCVAMLFFKMNSVSCFFLICGCRNGGPF